MNKLVEAISKAVPVYPDPAVNISGGLDSTIILHHLTEKKDQTIHTYTLGFPGMENEFNHAKKVADYYGTEHHEIIIEHMLDKYPKILRHFRRPRFNLWPYWLAHSQILHERKHVYIGEGGDEHFGGYWYKPRRSYVENWSSFFEFVLPTYETIYSIYNLNLIIPFHPNNLSMMKTYRYYDVEQNKQKLKKAYKNILPDFVLERRKKGGRFSYWIMWNNELKSYFPNCHPRSEEEIKWLLNKWCTREWLRVTEWEPSRMAKPYSYLSNIL